MELPTPYVALASAGTVTVLLWFQKYRIRAPYPPGPPADSIIGHLRALPQSNQEVVFREMSKQYGDILYFHIPGQSYLVLNSLKSAVDILDRRSKIYCDRGNLPLLGVMGWATAFALMPYGKRYLKQRRLVNEHLNQKKCVSYQPLQTQYARRLVNRLVANSDSDDLLKHLDRFAAEVIVKITYGKDIIDNDPYLDICERAVASLSSCGSPGGTPIDFFPFLKHFPSWFPGTYYASKARSYRPAVQKMYQYPFEGVKCQMREGTAQPSYIAYHLEQLHEKIVDEEHIEDLQGSAVQMFAGGAETTSSTLSHFVIAMLLFPDVQERAQQEIDNLIGKSRLPELSDRESLPYVQAVVSKVIRWHTAVPLGVPHSSVEDDIYNGMYIPNGTIVIANSFAILRDETIYENPDIFNPSRYLPKPEGNAEPYPVGHFGFGRRICVGQYLADASMFIAIATMLATLHFGRAKDDDGNEIVPEFEFVSGLTKKPKPFPCVIKPRDSASENLIKLTQLWEDSLSTY